MAGSGLTKPAQALTAKAIEAMKPDPAGPYRVRDTRCKGLALRVAPSGKTWDLSFRIKGAGVRRSSLGRCEDVSLEAARRRANELTSAARQGRDLIAEEETARDAHKQSFTIERLVNEYLKRRVTGRLRTANELERTLKRALAPMMNRKAVDIRRRDLRELLDAVADQGSPREAGKRRQAIGAMLKWAVTQDIIESNPADGLASYGLGAARDRVLSENEIRLLWRWLDDRRSISTAVADILKLQLCLGARCGEVAGMRASEFAKDNKSRLLWTLPAERSKNKRVRVTPITGLAAEIVSARLEADGEILFAAETGKPHYSGSVAQQLRSRWVRLPIARFGTHDLRRSVATAMTAQLGLPLELVATVVGHTTGGAQAQTQTLVRHYVRDDFVGQKLHALSQWDRRLRAILAGEAGQVIELRAR